MSDATRAKAPAKKPDPPAPVAQRAPAPEKGKGGPAAEPRQALAPAIPLGGGAKTAQRAHASEPKTAQRAPAPEAKAPVATAAKKPDPTGAKTAQRAALPGADDAVAHSPLKSGGAPAKNTILQTKMGVTGANDHWEQEADRAADQVLSGQPTGSLTPVTAAAAQRAGGEGHPSPQATGAAESAFAGRGSGSPLPAQLKSKAEQSTGADLSGVRVHDDANAQKAASSLGARAFTVGNDIAMGPGETKSNDRLLAHEVAHTVQQGAGGPVAQRGPTPPRKAAADPGTVDEAAHLITFNTLPIPQFKTIEHRGTLYSSRLPDSLQRQANYQRGNPDQLTKWQTDHQEAVRTKLQAIVGGGHGAQGGGAAPAAGGPLVLRGATRGGEQPYYVGTMDALSRRLTVPAWGQDGSKRFFDVDHIVELQVSGWPGDVWANTAPENFELVESEANQTSGRMIDSAINQKLDDFKGAPDHETHRARSNVDLKRDYTIRFRGVTANGGPRLNQNRFWQRGQIDRGDHLEGKVRLGDPAAVGGQGHMVVFTHETGGWPFRFSWSGNDRPQGAEANYLYPFRITKKTFNPETEDAESFGSLTVAITPNNRTYQVPPDGENEFSLPIRRIPGTQYAGYLNRQELYAKIKLHHKKSSPLQLENLEIEPGVGLVFGGNLLPDIPPLQGLQLRYQARGDDFELTATLGAGEIRVPPPFRIHDASLTFGLSSDRVSAQGNVDFGIDRVGQGSLTAGADTATGLFLDGQFEFEPGLFTSSNIEFHYRNRLWSLGGTATIGPGKVAGIRSGTVTVAYADGVFSASGNVVPTIPGVQNAQLSVRYSEAEGLVIGGDLALADIPGIRSGNLHAEVRRNPEGAWAVSATGTAQPNIPGLDSELSITYDRGLFVAQARAGFNRGMLSGQILAGATNGPVDDAGNPLPGAEPPAAGAPIRIFGGGQLTLQITPWLRGTAGVRILPNGELEVMGQIALPSSFELFAQHSIEKNLFRTPAIDIPIFGIAFAGMRAGLFATLSGGLDATASIGPGTLEDAHIGVTYNPSHEEQTTVEGGARLHIPAQAGLRLSGRAGLGLGIPGVSVTGNIEVGARLGLEGAIDTGITVSWSPARGLVIDAHGEFTVQPAFTFDIRGIALVEAGAFGLSVELYRQQWNLASFTFGSNLTFGVRFPIHYEEGKPFRISTDDLEFIAPPINIGDTLRGLLGQIA